MAMPIDVVFESRSRELTDGFKVRRVLPSSVRRMVGPFIFVDQMGPEILGPGRGLDVAPHPHIGLATVTYLFKGELMHRDGLGSVQPIRVGDVNWMLAGSGIVHSERSPTESRQKGAAIFGVQSWVALPDRYEEIDPAFYHHHGRALPVIEDNGLSARLIVGSLYGLVSPVKTYSEMFYADVELSAGATMSVPTEHEERAAFIVEGKLASSADGNPSFSAGQLIVFKPEAAVELTAIDGPARLLILGGEPVGKRHIWWNFVSSSKERIEQAKLDWRDGNFATVPGETEYIPLPADERHAVVRYP